MANFAIMVTPEGEAVDVDEKHLQAAEQSGLEPAMEMTDKEGQTQVVRAKHLRDAEKAGMMPKAAYDVKQASKTDLDPGTLESAGRGFANAGTLGFADEIAGAGEAVKSAGKKLLSGNLPGMADISGGYERGRDQYRNIDDAAWENNKAAYLAGGAVPALASLGAAGGAAASGVANLAKQGAVQGGLTALGGGTDAEGQADLTKGEFGKAAKDVAIGAATGGGLGAITGAVSPAIGKYLEDFAAKRATKSVADQAMKAQKLVDRLPNITASEASSLDPVTAQLNKQFNTSGKAFGRDLLDLGIVKGTKNTQGMYEAAAKAENESGKKIGDIYKAFDATNMGKQNLADTTLSNVINRIDEQVMAPLQELPGGSLTADKLRPYTDRLKKYLGDVQGQKKELTFDNLQSLKRDLDDLAFSEVGKDSVVQKQLQKMRNIFKNTIVEDAENITKTSNPALIPQLRQANREFSVASTAKNILHDKILREAKNRSVSPTDYLAGATGFLSGGDSTKMGLVKGAALALANKFGRQRGNQVLAGTSDSLANLIQNNPDVLNYLATKAGVSAEELLRGK